MKVTVGSENSQEYTRGGYKSVKGHIVLQHGTVNNALVAADLLMEKIRVTVRLARAGKTTVLMSQNLEVLVKHLCFNKAAFEEVNGDNGYEYQVETAGLDNIRVIGFELPFPTGLILKSGDECSLEVDFPSSAVSSNVDTTASHMIVGLEEGVVQSMGLPVIFSKSLQDSTSQEDVNFPDGLVYASFIDLGQTTKASSGEVIQSLGFQSDKVNLQWSGEEFLTNQLGYFQDGAEYATRYQSGVIVESPVPLKNSQVSLLLDSSNVSAGNCFVMGSCIVPDLTTIHRAQIAAKKHAAENQSFLGSAVN